MKPDIILIIMDDIGIGDITALREDAAGASGKKLTPNIDSMIENGTHFTNFYAPASICSPSRAGILTGCYPGRYGMNGGVMFPDSDTGIEPTIPNIAKYLRNNGYNTYFAGKWHLGDQKPFLPINVGYNKAFYFPTAYGLTPDYPGFDFPPLPLMVNDQVFEVNPNPVEIVDRFTSAIINYIEKRNERCDIAGEDRSTEPLFITFGHPYAHLPLYPPHNYLASTNYNYLDATIRHLDDTIGRIRAAAPNALIILTSDNGAPIERRGSNGNLLGGKHSAWEGGFRVPFIMEWKGHIPSGAIDMNIASGLDIFPTIIDIIGKKSPDREKMDGISLSDRIFRQSFGNQDREEPFAYYHKGMLLAVRVQRWKIVFGDARGGGEHDEVQLYDLYRDPGETTDLAHGDRYDGIVYYMRNVAAKIRADLGDVRLGIPQKTPWKANRVDKVVPLTKGQAQ